jgi:hypothetical protein
VGQSIKLYSVRGCGAVQQLSRVGGCGTVQQIQSPYAARVIIVLRCRPSTSRKVWVRYNDWSSCIECVPEEGPFPSNRSWTAHCNESLGAELPIMWQELNYDVLCTSIWNSEKCCDKREIYIYIYHSVYEWSVKGFLYDISLHIWLSCYIWLSSYNAHFYFF